MTDDTRAQADIDQEAMGKAKGFVEKRGTELTQLLGTPRNRDPVEASRLIVDKFGLEPKEAEYVYEEWARQQHVTT